MNQRWWIFGAVFLVLVMVGGKKLIETVTEQTRLNGLIPPARAAVRSLRQALLDKGIQTRVGRTLVTNEQQSKVDPGKTGTDNSFHEIGRAVDLYVYGPDGEPDMDGKYVDRYKTMHDEARRFGLSGLAFNADGSVRYISTKSGGKVWDAGHLQFTSGLSFAKALEVNKKEGWS